MDLQNETISSMEIKQEVNEDTKVHNLLYDNNIKKEPTENDDMITPYFNPVVSVKIEPKPTNHSQLFKNLKKSDLTPSSCDICHKKFPSLNILKLHERSHKNIFKAPNLLETTILESTSSDQVKLEIWEENTSSKGALKPEVNDVPNIENLYAQNLLQNKNTSVCTVDPNSHKIMERNQTNVKVELASQKEFFCKECNFEFYSEEDSRSHAQAHTGLFHCKKCDAKFDKRSLLQLHIQRHHENNRNHQCPVCEKSFLTKPNLTKHMYTHNTDLSHECEICHSKYKSRMSLQKHFYDVHKKRNVGFECKICKDIFPTTACLQKHHKLKHAEKNVAKCDYCDSSFTTKFSLNRHKSVVHDHEKHFTCEFCSKTFGWKVSLSYHMQAVHKRGISYNKWKS